MILTLESTKRRIRISWFIVVHEIINSLVKKNLVSLKVSGNSLSDSKVTMHTKRHLVIEVSY